MVAALERVGALLLGLLALDATVIVGLSVSQAALGVGGGESPGSAAAPPGPAPAEDDGWALCQTSYAGQVVTPVVVAVTYLDADVDAAVGADEVRSWFPDLPGGAVDVYLLEDRDGVRRIALQLAREKWPVWAEVAGDADGEHICGRVRAALLAHKIGRPGPTPAGQHPSRYDFEFFYTRRPQRYRSILWAGDLDYALDSARFPQLLAWLGRTT